MVVALGWRTLTLEVMTIPIEERQEPTPVYESVELIQSGQQRDGRGREYVAETIV